MVVFGFVGAALVLADAALLRRWARSLWGRSSQSALARELLGGHARAYHTREQVTLAPVAAAFLLTVTILAMLGPLLPEPVLVVGAVLVVVELAMVFPAKAYAASSLPKPYVLESYEYVRGLEDRDEGTWRQDYPQTTAVAPVQVAGRRPVLWMLVCAVLAVAGLPLGVRVYSYGHVHSELVEALSGMLFLAWAAGICGLWRMRRGLVRGYGLTLDSQGIHDRSSNRRARLIPWQAVGGVSEKSGGVEVMIDRDAPAYRALPLRHRLRGALGRKRRADVVIPVRYLDLTEAGLRELLFREHVVNTEGPDSRLLSLLEERAAAASGARPGTPPASRAPSASEAGPSPGAPHLPWDQQVPGTLRGPAQAERAVPQSGGAPSPVPGTVPPGFEDSDEPPRPPWETGEMAPPAWDTGVYPPPPLGSSPVLALPPHQQPFALSGGSAYGDTLAAGAGGAGSFHGGGGPAGPGRPGSSEHPGYPGYGGGRGPVNPPGQEYVPGWDYQPDSTYVPGQDYHPDEDYVPGQDYRTDNSYVPGQNHWPDRPPRT